MVSPSVLSADFGQLDRDIMMLNASHCDWIHLDVMDGVFVPNISFGFPVMQAIARKTEKPLDVHLMIEHPEKFIPEVKFCLGLTDVLQRNRPDLEDDPDRLKFTNSLKKATSKMIVLTFYFE